MLTIRVLKEIIKNELVLDSFRGVLLDFVPIGSDSKTWPKGTREDDVGSLEHSLNNVVEYLGLYSVDRIDVIKITNKGDIRLRIGVLCKKSILQNIRNLDIDSLNV